MTHSKKSDFDFLVGNWNVRNIRLKERLVGSDEWVEFYGKLVESRKLTDDRRDRVLRSIKEYFAETFEDEISDFRADDLLNFFVRELGPPIYNQAIQDSHKFIQDKLIDLEGEFYEPEEPFSR